MHSLFSYRARLISPYPTHFPLAPPNGWVGVSFATHGWACRGWFVKCLFGCAIFRLKGYSLIFMAKTLELFIILLLLLLYTHYTRITFNRSIMIRSRSNRAKSKRLPLIHEGLSFDDELETLRKANAENTALRAENTALQHHLKNCITKLQATISMKGGRKHKKTTVSRRRYKNIQ